MANMSDAVNMSFRVNKDLKKKADELFKALGINTSVALNMFLRQSVREQGLPFKATLKTPSERLKAALEELDAIEEGKIIPKKYKNFDEVLKEIVEEI